MIKDLNERELVLAWPDCPDELLRYVYHGVMLGGFWSAVLCNDLVGAVMADPENLKRLPESVKMIWKYLPSDCWGSGEKMTAWMAHDGVHGYLLGGSERGVKDRIKHD